MSIRSVEYSNNKSGWVIPKIHLHRINLFVGASAAGKTTLLNIIFGIATTAAAGIQSFPGLQQINMINIQPLAGEWVIELELNGVIFSWAYAAEVDVSGVYTIIRDRLIKKVKNTDCELIYEREVGGVKLRDQMLPNVFANQPGLVLFKNDLDIKLISDFFGGFLRRSFSGGELERAAGFTTDIAFAGKNKVSKISSFNDIASSPTLNKRLYLVYKDYPKKFENIVSHFVGIFPSVESLKITDAGMEPQPVANKIIKDNISAPIVVIKERKIAQRIFLNQLSSGMLKVLFMLTDIFTMNDGGVYFIDEYENSLGVNVIGFLPEILDDAGLDKQFILTSHNPYVINKISINDWFLIKRKDSTISITDGSVLEGRYSQSRQDYFIQLINDINNDI
ncbi:AAA family ATPase [Acidithiobacillus thiooxidans]|uniref:ATPase AAA-type core domain-containing protein n=1 Tax=Acidithiobacillus thiooxidans ATCC 19377 TaxID=637390 RepID=A0A543Q6L5_ACITH|nr:AAA family ATPase [Acidithiobacillus thiooxidans]MDX5933822.1 AAA family ATPase [Acidithiobacillus thiooxidans]TQN51961.1 hypothetical protein DLNHIDIE_01842 [Acidithiobacillus thiooxidans ATCC 19377]